MPDRIVVCLGKPPHENAGNEGFLSRARDLVLRAKAFGATLCTWYWNALSFSFQVDDLEEAIEFVTDPDARKIVHPFGIGISQGPLEVLGGYGGVELGWGLVVQKSHALSLLAKPGEVLVDCDMLAVHHVRLVTLGTRQTDGPPQLRAYRIAVDDPFRSDAERTVERLVEPALVGRDEALLQLEVAAGTLATVRAASGLGGTRLLRSLAHRDRSARWLLLEPVGHGMEPLGCLRHALCRRKALTPSTDLSEEHAQAWQALVHGRGANPAVVAEMLEAWLAGSGKQSGILLIDDANEIDSASLDVVATALLGAANPFRAVARLDKDAPLPAELGPLPPGPEVELGPLDEDQCVALVQAWTGGAMSDDQASVWADRAAGVPLALGETLAEALSTGELRWGVEGAEPRSIAPRSATPLSPSAAVAKRIRFLTPGSRAVLFALAAFGGNAPKARIVKLLEIAADVPVDLNMEQERLTRLGWLRVPEPQSLALPSRTHLRVIEQAVPETQRAAWHRAASNTIEPEGTLELAEAAWHAVEANDLGRAQRLARQASTLADAAGLENAARDLIAFARAHDPLYRPQFTSEASDVIPRPPMASSPGNPEDIFPIALAERGPRRNSRFTFPPVAVPDGELPSEAPSGPPSAPASMPCSNGIPLPLSSYGLDEAALSPSILSPGELPWTLRDAEEGVDAIPPPPVIPLIHVSHPSFKRARKPEQTNLESDGADTKLQIPQVDDPRCTVPYLPESSKPSALQDSSPPPPLLALDGPSDTDDTKDEEPTVRRHADRDPVGSVLKFTAQDAVDAMASASGPAPLPLEGSGVKTAADAGAGTAVEAAMTGETREVLDVPKIQPDSERTIETEDAPIGEGQQSDSGIEPSVIRALRSGKPEELDAWAARTLKAAPERHRVVERVRALVEMRPGNEAQAVRVLRTACEQAKKLSAIEQARSTLAFALGLARVGRPIEALVEGLEALSRAREAGDGKAEQACVAFLEKLYRDQGHQSAHVWRVRAPSG